MGNGLGNANGNKFGSGIEIQSALAKIFLVSIFVLSCVAKTTGMDFTVNSGV